MPRLWDELKIPYRIIFFFMEQQAAMSHSPVRQLLTILSILIDSLRLQHSSEGAELGTAEWVKNK